MQKVFILFLIPIPILLGAVLIPLQYQEENWNWNRKENWTGSVNRPLSLQIISMQFKAIRINLQCLSDGIFLEPGLSSGDGNFKSNGRLFSKTFLL